MKTLLGKELPFSPYEGQYTEVRNIYINDKERRSGMYILGVQGRGKSFFLAHLILQDLEKGYSVIIFDAHGDLLHHVIALLPPARLSKTYLLDLTDTNYPFGLNLFACSDPTNELERAIVVERVMHVFERLWPEIRGILLEKLLRYITLTFLECPECTLADIPRLLRDDTFRASIVSRLTNETVKAYWLEEFNVMKPGDRRRETQALDNRLAAFLSTPFIRNIVCQKKSTIDFRHLIQNHEVLLVDLNMKELKEHAALIGTILMTHIHAATFSFGELEWDQRPGYSLFVDEFQNFATTDFAELFKEGRKYGARITIAHQDRHDLLPEIRSATLTASIIASFQTTPADAMEMSPIYLDAAAKQRPSYIYPDILNRIRLHGQPAIQDFFHQYILPLQIESHKGNKHLLELLKDLIYQSVSKGSIDEKLFAAYVERMYPLLELTFVAPEQKRKQLRDKLQQHENRIAKLAGYLTSERAFRDYLIAYHSYFSAYAWNYRILWYEQPFVSADVLLTDSGFWHYLLNDGNEPPRERFETIMKELESYTAENDALHRRDTTEKIIAIERAEMVDRKGFSLRSIWGKITAIHELKSKYATNEAIQTFHAKMHRTCLSIADEQKGDPVYLYPVRSIAGDISPRTQVDELLVESLPFTKASSAKVAAWLADTPGQPVGRVDVNVTEAAKARTTVMSFWLEIVQTIDQRRQIAESLADDSDVLKAYYAELAKYPALQRRWYELSGGNADANVWDMVQKEAQKNAYRSDQLNTVEKLIQLRKGELQQKITLFIRERDTFRKTLPPLEKRIQQETDEIEQQRADFRSSVRRVIKSLIDDPGPLGEERTLRESDIKEMLLNLPKRQALVRVGGDLEQGPGKYRLQTPNVLQAAKKDEARQRLNQILMQSRAKNCRPRAEVERELGYTGASTQQEGEKRHGEYPGSWYEE